MLARTQKRGFVDAAKVGRVLSWVVPVASWATPSFCQDARDAIEGPLKDKFGQLTILNQDRNWEEDHIRISKLIDGFFDENGWNDESSEFARKVGLEVSAIPPWKPLDRISRFTDRIVERYRLDGANATKFKATMGRESGRLLMRHGGLIVRQLQEGMSARVEGRPFTAEQIAKWTKESQPLIAEVSQTVERICAEVSPLLDAKGQQMLARDLRSFQQRQRVVSRIADEWSKGMWLPEDWGLQDDPIQRSVVPSPKEKSPPSKPNRVSGDRSVERKRCTAYEPSTWSDCVAEFETRFKLDAGQRNAARSILTELRDRAEAYLRTHEDVVRTVPMLLRGSDESFAAIRSTHAELRVRLDAILTSSQRDKGRN